MSQSGRLAFLLHFGGPTALAMNSDYSTTPIPRVLKGAFDNMNGEYLTTPTLHAPKGSKFNTKWSEYPGGVDYFEVYLGPITSLYSEVWWKRVPAVELPADLSQRFDGKGMAIVGYETDAVRRTPEGDISVPINMAYNHHHDVYITGKYSKMHEVPYDPHDLAIPMMARSNDTHLTVPIETSESPLNLPTSLHLADGNGGEYRKSYHGFSAPVAYVIDSPQSVNAIPMFIDTWNRDAMNISGGSPFVAGPLPKRSLAPKGAPYSGLLECPLTDRIQKILPGGNAGYNTTTYTRQLFECTSKVTSCAHPVGSARECFDAARSALGKAATLATSQGSSSDVPSGCTISYDGHGGARAFFNTEQTKQCCGAAVQSLEGQATSLVEMQMRLTNDTTTLTLTGPDGVWFGVGFFAQAMEERPYAIIVAGNGTVSERRLAGHMGSYASPAGGLLAPSLKVASSTVADGKRTVVVTRPSAGSTEQHASFTLQDVQIPFINAIGGGASLGYHRSKTASYLTLWPHTDQPLCLCSHPAAPFGAARGTIKYLPTGEQFGFINACQPEPRESVLAHRNPTCDVRAYRGGLQVCKHGWSLLDAAQAQPWPNQPLIYWNKYRFYYQEYQPRVHVIALPRAVWAIGAFIGEYDVPQCKPGTPVADCKHEIWGVVRPAGDNLHVAAMHFHCHAPTCLAMEIWNNRTGELLCRQEPVYGGTGRVDLPKFDETGYILQPPCLWGDAPGLEAMPRASGEAFTVKAITNSTVGHHGEMAFPEITLVPWNTSTGKAQPGKSYTAGVQTEWHLIDFGGGLGGRRRV